MINSTYSKALAAGVVLFCGVCSGQGFGVSVTGTVTYAGASAPKTIKPEKDVEVCGRKKLVEEQLIVNPANGGLANVVVALVSTSPVPTHPEAMKRFQRLATVDNVGCRFYPRVTLAMTGQSVSLVNSDAVAHNMKVDSVENDPMNPILPPMTSQTAKFTKVERLPTPITCGIHPWMKGWLYVRDNPYMAISDENGNFEIPFPPAGDWDFLFWHEELAYLNKAKIAGKTPKKGRVTLTIVAGKPTALGSFQAN